MLNEQTELTGTVHQGVIVIDSPVKLPEGQTVKIIVEAPLVIEASSKKTQTETVGQRLMKFAGTIEGLPPDFALNHDHYLFGAEKRDADSGDK
ncbi:MAG: hypothetical protein M3X11_13045 [Acidobacteriota bacterium]|nr:hypothetical protein [Acidobacteriota bacterium]